MTKSRNYDAIVIGGGHNGLINGAYLAKAGSRRSSSSDGLRRRRRHHRGAGPGFHFTTFSYALSLLRRTSSTSSTSSATASCRC
jgi:hypothetical protein